MTKQQRGELQSGRLQKGKKNDKSKKGEIVMKGSIGTVITDFLGICSGFIDYLEDGFKCDEEKAINSMSMFVDIVKEDRTDLNEAGTAARVFNTLEYLKENEQSEVPETIVIEADSAEDASKQLNEVLKKILEKAKTEGDK